MGKYDFGARVRDFEGDEGYIVGKMKGRRQVKFDAAEFIDTWLDKSDLTVLAAPSLVGKVVEGGMYLSRNGETFGPIRRSGDDGFPWVFDGDSWSNDGRFFVGEHRFDLVVELSTPEKTDEKSEAKAGFKVGDRVKIVSSPYIGVSAQAGSTGIISSGSTGRGDWKVLLDGGERLNFHNCELIAAPAATTKFKVGDRVEFTDACPTEWWFGPEKKYKSGVIVQCKIYGGYKHGVQTDGGTGYVNDEHIRLATPAASAPHESHIVCRMFNGKPRPNGRPFVHATMAGAETEAQRLADLHGGEFAVYSRGETKTVDAGPVPESFHVGDAKAWLKHGEGNADDGGMAFCWANTPQGFSFWEGNLQHLTPKGRAILTKWLAEVEAQASLETA